MRPMGRMERVWCRIAWGEMLGFAGGSNMKNRVSYDSYDPVSCVSGACCLHLPGISPHPEAVGETPEAEVGADIDGTAECFGDYCGLQ